MVDSFLAHGFTTDDCEYLYVDNSERNVVEGFSGVNRFLTSAKGAYIILCHQDIVLFSDGRPKLDTIIEELNRADPAWGLFGNGGGIYPGRIALRLTDPHGENQFTEPLPAKVSGLDENFILVRRDANLAVSRDLRGFHLYGTDLCVIADILGYNAYVVDFHLRHISAGNSRDGLFSVTRSELVRKYSRAFRFRIVTTPTTFVFLTGRGTLARMMNSRPLTALARRIGLIVAKLGY